MKKTQLAVTLAAALALALAFAVHVSPASAQGGDFDVTDGDGESPGKGKKGRGAKVAKAGVCLIGGRIVAAGHPVPLPKMSKRQWKRYETEVVFYQRARIYWAVGCAALGPVGGGGLIAGADFVSRFITRERPIKRTTRQEQQIFCRDGSSPCPSLVGPDMELYGPK